MAEAKSNGEGTISKMEGVRRTLDALGMEAKPTEIQKYLKKQFKIAMSPNMISNYKSTIKTAASKSKVVHTPAAPAAKPQAPSINYTLEELTAVKQVADRIGADKVQQLAKVLAK